MAENAALAKIMSNFTVTVGWDPAKPTANGKASDLDLIILILKDGVIIDVVYYKKMESDCGSIRHSGDNRDGEGAGIDELVHGHLGKLPSDVTSVIAFLVIHDGQERDQNFGQLEVLECQLFDDIKTAEQLSGDNNKEKPFHTFTIPDKDKNKRMMRVATWTREDGGFKYERVWEGYEGDQKALEGLFAWSPEKPYSSYDWEK